MPRRKTQNEYMEELKCINPNIIVLEDYINNYTPILHKCIKHDIEWKIRPNSVLCGQGCLKCGSEKISKKLGKTHMQYVNELKEKNPNIIALEQYVNAHTKILHKCLIDGHEWMVAPSQVLTKSGCP